MVEENPLHRGNEKNIADSMHLAVCWNVVSAEQVFPDEDGIAVQNKENNMAMCKVNEKWQKILSG